MPQDHGTASRNDDGPATIALAPLGSAAAIVSWTRIGEPTARRGFRLVLDGRPVPPPATHCCFAIGGGQRHLLAVPLRAARLAQGRLEVTALDGSVVAQADRSGMLAGRTTELDPLGIVPELEPRDAIRVVRFLLEIAPSLFKLGRDQGFIEFARALVEILAPSLETVAPRCCAGPLAFFESAVHRAIGDRLSAVLVARSGVSRVMTAPGVLPHPQPQRGLARIALAVDRAGIAPETSVVILGEGGIACRRLPATEPAQTAFERASRGEVLDAPLRNFIVDSLAGIDAPGVPTDALIRELRAATVKLQIAAPSGAVAGGVDLVLPTAMGVLVAGWLSDPHQVVEALTLARRERRSHVPVAGLLRFRHPVADREGVQAGGSGFIFVVEGGAETPLHASIQLQIRLGSGEIVALGDGPTQIYPGVALTRILDTLAALPNGGRDALARIAPVLHALHAVQPATPQLEQQEIGRRVAGARVAVLVPVRGDAELLRLRFAAMALDPTIAAAEIVHVVPDPQRAEQVTALLRATAQLYGHGTRVAIATRACTTEAALNAAAATVEAPLMVLLGAGSMPVGADWLAPMLHELEANPRAGLVAARRLNADLSVVDCGHDRETDSDGRTRFVPRLAGFPVTFPATRLAVDVAASTRGAWLLRRSLFELVGGLSTDSLTRLGADLDFCCRVRAAGVAIRHAAAPDFLEIDDGTPVARENLAVEIDQRRLLERWPFRPLDTDSHGTDATVSILTPAPATVIEESPQAATVAASVATAAEDAPADSKRSSVKRRPRRSRRAA